MRHTLALLLLLVASPACADPALWVARGQNATVYLFGTIHVLPAGERWMDDAIKTALEQSSEVWTEADISDLSGSQSAIRHYGLGAAQDTEALLPADYRARFRHQTAALDIPNTVLATARPWLIEILLMSASLRRVGGAGRGVEPVLLAYARAHHMATPHFETLDQQFAMLADMPQDVQLASLEDEIDAYDDAGPQFHRMLTAWHAGDEAALDHLINWDMRRRSVPIWTELILRRNERFAETLAERLSGSGTAFVAVGAAHLCGSTGVPQLLRNRGFSVERVR